MKKAKLILRLISLFLFLVAVVFIICALCCPTCGSVFYIGSFQVTTRVLHWFYNSYIIVMLVLFLLSFVLPKKK